MRFPVLAICGGMCLGAWGISVNRESPVPENDPPSPGAAEPRATTAAQPAFLSQLDAIDARVSKLRRAYDACGVLLDRTDYAARQRTPYERHRAARAVVAAHVAAREARDAAEGWTCKP